MTAKPTSPRRTAIRAVRGVANSGKTPVPDESEEKGHGKQMVVAQAGCAGVRDMGEAQGGCCEEHQLRAKPCARISRHHPAPRRVRRASLVRRRPAEQHRLPHHRHSGGVRIPRNPGVGTGVHLLPGRAGRSRRPRERCGRLHLYGRDGGQRPRALARPESTERQRPRRQARHRGPGLIPLALQHLQALRQVVFQRTVGWPGCGRAAGTARQQPW